MVNGAGMVETLTLKATAWEKERGLKFLYDGVSNFKVRPRW